MKAGSFLGVALTTFATLVGASDVLDLHKDDFTKSISKEPLVLVECAALSPVCSTNIPPS
jgi:hypothetical protein